MRTLADMRATARGQIADAAVLIRGGRYDTAYYLCGYAVEVSLKARVCRTLRWTEFPSEPKEWQRHYAFLKVHEFDLLAKWSGYELELSRGPYLAAWQEVTRWNPATRYNPPGSVSRLEAMSMRRSTRTLADLLNPR